jgi:hypothetical protein
MKILRFVLCLFASATVLFSLPGRDVSADAKPTSILPTEFSGWNLVGKMQDSRDPAVADPVNAAVLKEYGFADLNSAIYARDDGRKLTLKAARFKDASGAYGAFTYYKIPQMQKEKIGDQGASFNERVLFYRGNILIDAQFERLSAMSAAELRDLSAALPPPPGNAAGLPGLPAYLPTQNYVKNTAKYVVGPVALDKVGAPINEQFVDFNAGAEVVLGDYAMSDGAARLLLISYPTPQIAMEHLRRIDSAKQQTSLGSPAIDPETTFDKRTGPIVAVVSGSISPSEAKSMLASVNYEADVTWNENTYFSRKDNAGNLLVNVIYLCAIIGGFAVISGVAFGGIRLLAKRFFPDKLFDRPDMGLISLHLSGDGHQASTADVSSSINAG